MGRFLRDVFILAVTGFGGPQVHISQFLKRLVEKKEYLSSKELLEIMSLGQMLPGPTSSQTIVGIGYRIGGLKTALLTLLIWITPAMTLMICYGIFESTLGEENWVQNATRFLPGMAVGFVWYAAWKMGTKVMHNGTAVALYFLTVIISTGVVMLFGKTPYSTLVFPGLIILGGLATARVEKGETIKFSLKSFWPLGLLLGLYGAIWIFKTTTSSAVGEVSELLYRSGSLIFGGGQVLIPLIQHELVNTQQLVSNETFLSGYGMVNSLPGPVFSLSAFIGTTAVPSSNWFQAAFHGLIGAISLFAPGMILIIGLMSNWDKIREITFLKTALIGMSVVGAALVLSAGVLLTLSVSKVGSADYEFAQMLAAVLALGLLFLQKVPAPVIVGLAILCGIFI